jgi:DnaK suppressor protein
METDIDIEHFRSRLQIRREDILSRTAEAKESAGTVELDQSRVGRLSRMDALQSQAMSQEAQRRRSVELTRISSALQRIVDGEYGYCVSCGEQIAIPRLEFDPAATQCLVCAQSSE